MEIETCSQAWSMRVVQEFHAQGDREITFLGREVVYIKYLWMWDPNILTYVAQYQICLYIYYSAL